uniref:Endothelin-converting protein 9 n=1 Tax=Tityus serrulatus TaxID=6887 RepID=A0A1S5QNT0_TITSE|nr:endothelin-converting protein 9 [Tityus serrulatus]
MNNSESKEKYLSEKKCMIWKKRTVLERFLMLGLLLLLIAFLTSIGLLLRSQKTNIVEKPRKDICLTRMCKYQAGSILSNMDLTVNPCEDFFKFACGSNRLYQNIYDDEIRVMHTLLNYMIYLGKEQLEKPNYTNDPTFVKKVKKYYESCLNKPTALKEVVKEFLYEMNLDTWPQIENDKSKSTIEEAATAAMVYKDMGLLIGIFIRPIHPKITLDLGYVTIHSDVLLNNTEEKFIKLKKEYTNLMNYVFGKLGLSARDSNKYVKEMIEFETSLAKIQEDYRRGYSSNSTISELRSKCPQIKWTNLMELLFEYIHHSEYYTGELQIRLNENYINALCELIGNTTNKRAIYNLLLWNVFIRYLPRFDYYFRQRLIDMKHVLRFRENFFKPLSGIHKLKWKSCIQDMESYVRTGLDYIMIKSMNPEKDVKEVQEYVNRISESMEEVFSEDEWMDDYSKNVSIVKINRITSHIGYGEIPVDKDFINLLFDNINFTDNYIQNILQVRKRVFSNHIFNENITAMMYKDYISEPMKVTAYYSDGEVEGRLAITLGIMNPPFYNYNSPKYLNFGGISFVIAHEFSHGFAELYFNEEKLENLTDADEDFTIHWPKEFMQEYNRRRDCLIRQYSQLSLGGNMTVDGDYTIKDNFADNNALTVSFRAYEKYLKQYGKEPSLPGLDFSNEQMYFIGYGQVIYTML